MKQISLALSKEESSEYAMLGYDDEDRRPKYSYGTSISLNDEQLKALGFESGIPTGALIKIEGQGIVTDDGSNITPDGVEVRCCIQITDLGAEPVATASNPADILYGKGK